MTNEKKDWPVLGCGVGLRSKHYPDITTEWPQMDWFEAISENYMDTGGRPVHILEQVRHHYPIVLHGTSLSIGSCDPLNLNYLKRLKRLIDRIEPQIVSDHLCWSGIGGDQLHDLLPLPYTEEAINHLVSRVQQLQEFLGRKVLLENVSTYVTYRHSTIPEWEFLTAIAKRSGCGILFDVNNAYVNSFNHKFDPLEFVKGVPGELVGQIHLAGHTNMGEFLFDTHSSYTIDPVWELYREALKRWGQVSTLIEWDENIPSFDILTAEAEKAKKIYREYKNQKPDQSHGHPEEQSDEGSLRFFGLRPQNDRAPQISLAETQDWMKSRIKPRLEPLTRTSSAETLLNPQASTPGEERISVYAGGYYGRVHESLSEVYEAVHHVLGDDAFIELSNAYAPRYPSHDYNLNFVGRHLPEFLKTYPLTQQLPFLPDLAKLEWQIRNAFHAFDEMPMNPAELAAIPMDEWENAKIIFQPSVSLFSSPSAIFDIWKSRKECSDETRKIDWHHRQLILVGRKGVQVRCEPLDKIQYQMLEGLLAGKNLGVICEELSNASEDSLPIGEWFARWVTDGLIQRCEFSKKSSPQSCC